MNTVTVIYDGYIDVEARETTAPRSRSVTGYGKNMPTSTEVFFKGRWRRVYATCYSNAAAFHINYNGGKCLVL